MSPGLTLDAGALIAVERADRAMLVLLARALERALPLTVPAGVVAQVWRDGRRQVRLARLLSSRQVTIEPLTDPLARAAGQLCGARASHDVIDAAVVLGARARRDHVVTSDPDDLARLDPHLPLIVV
ncbi:MAG: hypothetical protein KBG28_15370 [Kofleriaceae bacterium]|nr:hypothetical protein [Kofleriaceae bacterium]